MAFFFDGFNWGSMGGSSNLIAMPWSWWVTARGARVVPPTDPGIPIVRDRWLEGFIMTP